MVGGSEERKKWGEGGREGGMDWGMEGGREGGGAKGEREEEITLNTRPALFSIRNKSEMPSVAYSRALGGEGGHTLSGGFR